jgi:hypothetical protein
MSALFVSASNWCSRRPNDLTEMPPATASAVVVEIDQATLGNKAEQVKSAHMAGMAELF